MPLLAASLGERNSNDCQVVRQRLGPSEVPEGGHALSVAQLSFDPQSMVRSVIQNSLQLAADASAVLEVLRPEADLLARFLAEERQRVLRLVLSNRLSQLVLEQDLRLLGHECLLHLGRVLLDDLMKLLSVVVLVHEQSLPVHVPLLDHLLPH